MVEEAQENINYQFGNFEAKYLSPKSPNPGTMYLTSFNTGSMAAVITLTFGY